MAISTLNGLLSAITTSPAIKLMLGSMTNVAGGFVCCNQATGNSFGTLLTPTNYASGGQVYNNNSSTITGIPNWTANGGGVAATYLAGLNFQGAVQGTFYVYDLLWACSGMVGNTTNTQSVSAFNLPSRNATGLGAELWAWDFTALGATASNITASYTNSAGTTGRTTVSTAMITSFPVGRMLQLPLQSGDTGIQKVASVTLSASTGTAGSFGLAIMQRIAVIPILMPGVTTNYDFAALGFPNISDTTTMLFVNHSTTTSSGVAFGAIQLAQG